MKWQLGSVILNGRSAPGSDSWGMGWRYSESPTLDPTIYPLQQAIGKGSGSRNLSIRLHREDNNIDEILKQLQADADLMRPLLMLYNDRLENDAYVIKSLETTVISRFPNGRTICVDIRLGLQRVDRNGAASALPAGGA